jgi:hypothetical protein
MAHAVRVRTAEGWQDIAIEGPQGPLGPVGPMGVAGPQGPAGAIELYEQPDTPPDTASEGAIWIDTDEPPLATGGGGDAFAFFNG